MAHQTGHYPGREITLPRLSPWLEDWNGRDIVLKGSPDTMLRRRLRRKAEYRDRKLKELGALLSFKTRIQCLMGRRQGLPQ